MTSSSISLTVTLSRAHKIAERLKAGALERFNSAQQGLIPRVEYSATLAPRAKGLTAAAEKSQETLKEAVAWSEAAVAVRTAIGNANQTAGIASLLAEQAGVNQRLNWYQQLVTAQSDGNPQIADVLNAPSPMTPERGITLSMLSPAAIEDLRASHAALKRQAFALSDRIAMANAAPITLSLPAAIAEHVSGA